MRRVAEKILTTCEQKADSMIGAFALNLEVSSYLWDAAPQLAQAYLDQQETLKAREEELRRVREENVRLTKKNERLQRQVDKYWGGSR